MKNKMISVAFLLLGGCVATSQLVEEGEIKASEFKGGFSLPDQQSVSFKYERQVFPGGGWRQTISWTSGGPEKRFVMHVLDANGTTYLMNRVPFSQAVPKMDTGFENKNLKFGKVFGVKSEFGIVDSQRFSVEDNECVAFFQALRLHPETAYKGIGDGLLEGFYCSAKGTPLKEEAIMKFLSSIRFKGETL